VLAAFQSSIPCQTQALDAAAAAAAAAAVDNDNDDDSDDESHVGAGGLLPLLERA